MMRRRFIRVAAILGLLAAFIPVLTFQPAFAAGVVGNGNPASCTEVAFDAALAGGGLVTFDCGPAQHTITLTTEKVIANNTEIDGGDLIRLDMNFNARHFYVAPPVTLQLSNIRLDNGVSATDGGLIWNDGAVIANDVIFSFGDVPGNGGAIRNDGSLNLIDGFFTTNLADGVGASIYNAATGTTTITGDSTFFGSLADFGDGGAIYNDGGIIQVLGNTVFDTNVGDCGGAIANSSGGSVTIDGATFDGNGAVLSGGAICNASGTVSISNSTFNNNDTVNFHGGAIYNAPGAGTVTLINSTITESDASDEGGAIWNGASLFVISSQISDSDAVSGSGGGIFNSNAGAVTITRSTFARNSSGFRGGALRNGGTATIETSTFSDNSASNQGGAIVNHNLMTIDNSTIASNNSGLAGGGIRNAAAGTLTMTNTIVASNLSGGDCSNAGVFNSGDYNLDSDTTCPIGMANDISGGNANLQALGDNGGATETHPPGPGSDAIDNGPGACASPDQRGQFRPQNGVCDIGSVEVIPPADVCYNTWTLELQAPVAGECNGPYLQKVVFEDFGPHYLCRNVSTGQLSYSYLPTCAPYNFPAIVMPDAAPLSVCLNIYTNRYRQPLGIQTCSAGEFPTVLQ